MKRYLFFSFVFVSMALGTSDTNITRYDFDLTGEKKATAYVDWDAQKIEVKIGKKRVVLPDISKEMMNYQEFISESLFFEDLNFDGYTDIGVVVGIGYGGVNIFTDYYFYDPKEDQFHKYLSNVSNLIEIKGTKILHAPMKSANDYTHAFYQINAEGRPFVFLSAETSWSGEYEGEMQTEYSFKSAKVKVKKAYFYDSWNGKKLENYMRQGEKISAVLDMESYEGESWVKVLYRGKERSIKQWVRLDNLLFEEMEKEN